MESIKFIQNFIPELNSPEKIYELFRGLGYNNILDPSYKRKIEEFEFAKEERNKIKNIYTVFNYDGKLQIFLIEVNSISVPFIRYLAKRMSDKYLKFLLILTSDYKEYSFVLPEFTGKEGKHKLKVTKLLFDRDNLYHTDLLTISNISLLEEEISWRDIWKRWKEAFSVEKVTDTFFQDYKKSFFELRNNFEKQKIPVKKAHELSQQFLNRLMFLYFISKKKWLNDNPKFIRWYWERYKEEKRKGTAEENSFYENWLRVLYLEAFNNKYSHPHYHPQDVKSILASAPYLNGGLFKSNNLDELRFQINDSLFENVFNYYEKYNFTIREELPLDVEVAVDPQMIGYVYESLSNVAEEIYERQDLGIFYTPTVEVDFMCRRSVVEYLAGYMPEIPKEWIYRLLFDEDKKSVAEFMSKKNLWYRLEELLDNLAVIDPACGSGAFLVGMLHVLVELYRLIYSYIHREMTEFELKKKIIGNSLYGVDIMSWAVHSAELRLWLQLIIEENIPHDQRKLFPLLPNLNLKLRVGDSLVQEVGGINLHFRDSKLSPALKRKLMSLKSEKEKYYGNDPTAKFKTDKALLDEELRIFGEILGDKIITLQKDIQILEGRKHKLQYEMFQDFAKEGPKQKILFENEIKRKEDEIGYLKDTKRKIQTPEQKPLIWEIDFAEIFGEKGGFDIVIGNPPYVRQEKIAPPNKLKSEISIEDKKAYKDRLLKSIQAHYPFINKLDKKSDYYIYFYFHGLALLNEKGTFCFITSNSWLDVGYGKDLQKFLLQYCHIKAVYDNEAKRSFEHADVNTIIALFGAPAINRSADTWPALNETSRFVMFKKPFEEAINTKNLLAIEKTESIQKTEAYRVYPVNQEALLEEGWEKLEDSEESEARSPKPRAKNYTIKFKEKFQTGKYEGNKWGGKYLRAPDIFFTILEKGEREFVRIGDIADVKFGIKTGADNFFYLKNEEAKNLGIEKEFINPIFVSSDQMKGYVANKTDTDIVLISTDRSPNELQGSGILEYIKLGETKAFRGRGGESIPAKRPSCVSRRPYWYSIAMPSIPSIYWMEMRRERYFTLLNTAEIAADHTFYSIYPKGNIDSISLCGLLNTTLIPLLVEVFANDPGGGGTSLQTPIREIKKYVLLPKSLLNSHNISKAFLNLAKRQCFSIIKELGINPTRPIREQKPNPLPDRKALDDIVFDILDLTEAERDEVYWAVCELVKNRLDKARSLK